MWGGRQNSFSQGRHPVYGKDSLNKTLVLHDAGFSNKLVTGTGKKALPIILEDASCLRTERANKFNPCR
jgi:hypothetical protein